MVSSSFLATAVALAYQAGRTTAASYCDASFAGSNVCLAEFTSTSSVTYRIAVPEAASAGAAFDTLLQIVAPAATGWAGVAWGGAMANNPLTVGWPSGDNGAIVSSRWATGHTLPTAYAGASYRTLASSKNATHWTLSVVCSGCSHWGSAGAALTQAANTLAWASSTRAVTTPASNTSTFGYHTGRGTIAVDLSAAKVPQAVFDKYVAFLASGSTGGAPAPPAPPPSSPSSSVAAPPPPPPSSATSVHPTHSSPPPSHQTGSVTTIISTVYITLTPSGSATEAPAPPSSTTIAPPVVSPHPPTIVTSVITRSATKPTILPTTITTITPPWKSATPRPAPTEGSGDDDNGGDDNEPTITVTVIEGGTVPTGAPPPPTGPPAVGGGVHKGPLHPPPFHHPPPFRIPPWA